MEPKMKTHKVQVVVPKRGDGLAEMYAAHKPMPEGASDQEFTDAELVDVFSRPGLVVMQHGKQVKTHTDLEGGAHFSLDDLSEDEKAKADPNSAFNAAKRASRSHHKSSHKGVISPPSPTLVAGGAEPSYDGTDVDGKSKEPDGVSVTTTTIPSVEGATLKSKTTTATGADASIPFPDEPLVDAPDTSSSKKHGKRY